MRRARARPPAGAATVLCYHGFGQRSPAADPNNLFVPAEDFERQVRLLARLTRPLTLAAFLRGGGSRRGVLLTIDDGYRSTLEIAAPVLARHGVPAALFALPGRLGGTSSWMAETPDEPLVDADELRQLQRDYGIDVESHGWDHRPLWGLDAEELRRQTAASREALADVTGRRPRTLAYPYGHHDPAARRAVGDAGYEAAFALDQPPVGRWSLGRRVVTTRDALPTFVVKLLPGFETAWSATAGHPRLRRLAARVARQRPGPAGPGT